MTYMPQKKTKKSAAPTLPPLFPTEEELGAAYALSRYPLFHYADRERVMRVQLMTLRAREERLYPLLRMIIWCGQMTAFSLIIRIASDDAQAVREKMLEEMPLLRAYSDISGQETENTFVRFVFEDVPDFALAARANARREDAQIAAQRIVSRMTCPWTAILMGDKTALFAARLAPFMEQESGHALLLDCEKKEMKDDFAALLSCMRSVLYLCGSSSARTSFEHRLYLQARRVSAVYMGYGHAENNSDGFHQDAFGRASSAAAALHIPYKLADADVKPDAPRDTIVKKLDSLLSGEDSKTLHTLSALEHRRWIMYHAVDGWRAASADLCRRVCFAYESELDAPCFKFKIAPLRRHPALVPGEGAATLYRMDRASWDAFDSEEKIDASGFDPLDRISLKLHLIAGEKMKSGEPVREQHLEDLRALSAGKPDAAKACAAFSHWYRSEGCSNVPRREDRLWFDFIRSAYAEADVPSEKTDKVLSLLDGDLKVVKEYYSYTDYKLYDTLIIQQMADIYCRPEKLTLIKLSAGMLDNAAAALLTAPARAVYFGLDQKACGALHALLLRCTPVTSIACIPPKDESMRERVRRMKTLLKKEIDAVGPGGLCVADVTGASAQDVSALWQAKQALGAKLGVIRCDTRTQQVENLSDYPLALACRRQVRMQVKDVMSLFGTKASTLDESESALRSLLLMESGFESLWRFAVEDKPAYEAFFSLIQEEYQPGFALCGWNNVQIKRKIPSSHLTGSGLNALLGQLEEARQIKDLRMISLSASLSQVSFLCPMETAPKMASLLEDVRRGDVQELSLAMEDTACVVRFSRLLPAKETYEEIASWRGENGVHQVVHQMSVSAALYHEAQIDALLESMLSLKLLKETEGSGRGYLRVKGMYKVIGGLCRAISVLQERDGVLPLRVGKDRESLCLLLPEAQRESVMEELSLPRISGAMGECVIRMRERTVRATHFDRLVREIARRQGEKMTCSVEEDLLEPEYVCIRLSGMQRILGVLSSLAAQMEKEPVYGLSYDKGTIFPHHSCAYCVITGDESYAAALERAKDFGVIHSLCREGCVHRFHLAQRELLRVFEKKGNLFEFYTWYQARRQPFDDVQSGYRFSWGEQTENELDVLACRGMQLMLVSCKNTAIYEDRNDDGDRSAKCKYNMYEIRMLADQFSKDTKAVLAYLTQDTPTKELKKRASSLGVEMIVLAQENASPNENKALGKKLFELV